MIKPVRCKASSDYCECDKRNLYTIPDGYVLVPKELIARLEWALHEYDPAHGHTYTCPICGGAKDEPRNIHQHLGHRKGCAMIDAAQREG